ncbi:MAG TPA: HAMP domain-containing sensor histidine kinase [bacterium]|nr:HAMP domain-containing sensor histidine kinase [bacterium]
MTEGSRPKSFILARASGFFWTFAERGELFGRATFLWTLVFLVNLQIYLVLTKIIIPSDAARAYFSPDNLAFFVAVMKWYLLCGVLGYISLPILKVTQNNMSDTYLGCSIVLVVANFIHICLFFGGMIGLLAPLFLLITITYLSIFMSPRIGRWGLFCSVTMYLGAVGLSRLGYIPDMSVILDRVTFKELFTAPTLVITFSLIIAFTMIFFEYFIIYIVGLLNYRTKQTLRLNEELTASNRKLRELDVMKDNFLSLVSHDLRTPMTSIEGYASIMLERLGRFSEQDQKLSLEIIVKESQRLARLINDLLDLQRFAAGKMELDFQDLDLSRLARESADLFRGAAYSKKISLETALPDTAVWVSGNADRLSQVMANLLSNAVKFTPANGRVILSIAMLAGEERPRVKVSVSDTGPGTAPELRRGIFDKFQQVDKFTRPREHGAGVGLALAREIIEAHGGRIGLADGRGQGSEFYFILDVKTGRDQGEENPDRGR